jgi:hypothetical protein
MGARAASATTCGAEVTIELSSCAGRGARPGATGARPTDGGGGLTATVGTGGLGGSGAGAGATDGTRTATELSSSGVDGGGSTTSALTGVASASPPKNLERNPINSVERARARARQRVGANPRSAR